MPRRAVVRVPAFGVFASLVVLGVLVAMEGLSAPPAMAALAIGSEKHVVAQGRVLSSSGEGMPGWPWLLTAHALIGHLNVTASIAQSHAAWLTEPYIMVEFAGLEHDWQRVSGSIALTRDVAADLARLLSDLAAVVETTFAEQVADHLSSLSYGERR